MLGGACVWVGKASWRRARANSEGGEGKGRDESVNASMGFITALLRSWSDRCQERQWGSCPKAGCPGRPRSTRLLLFFFILHLRIFYNPGRQLDPVVVILLNGKIQD